MVSLALLLLLACAPGGSQQHEELAGSAEHDDWHPREHFSEKPVGLSTMHMDKVRAAAHLLALGKSDDALIMCNKVLRNDPEHAPCLTMKAKVLAAQGFAQEARKCAQDAIDFDPGWAAAYEVLASIYAAQGQAHILQVSVEFSQCSVQF